MQNVTRGINTRVADKCHLMSVGKAEKKGEGEEISCRVVTQFVLSGLLHIIVRCISLLHYVFVLQCTVKHLAV
jgi:hypothetical protein